MFCVKNISNVLDDLTSSRCHNFFAQCLSKRFHLACLKCQMLKYLWYCVHVLTKIFIQDNDLISFIILSSKLLVTINFNNFGDTCVGVAPWCICAFKYLVGTSPQNYLKMSHLLDIILHFIIQLSFYCLQDMNFKYNFFFLT